MARKSSTPTTVTVDLSALTPAQAAAFKALFGNALVEPASDPRPELIPGTWATYTPKRGAPYRKRVPPLSAVVGETFEGIGTDKANATEHTWEVRALQDGSLYYAIPSEKAAQK